MLNPSSMKYCWSKQIKKWLATYAKSKGSFEVLIVVVGRLLCRAPVPDSGMNIYPVLRVDLRGEGVVLSGSNNRTGRESAQQFAAWYASLISACPDPSPTETHPRVMVGECGVRARNAARKIQMEYGIGGRWTWSSWQASRRGCHPTLFNPYCSARSVGRRLRHVRWLTPLNGAKVPAIGPRQLPFLLETAVVTPKFPTIYSRD